MDRLIERLRSSIDRRARRTRADWGVSPSAAAPSAASSATSTSDAEPHPAAPIECSWEAMREVYEEQAARGVPEAVRGLERIEQDRWPTSGRQRET